MKFCWILKSNLAFCSYSRENYFSQFLDCKVHIFMSSRATEVLGINIIMEHNRHNRNIYVALMFFLLYSFQSYAIASRLSHDSWRSADGLGMACQEEPNRPEEGYTRNHAENSGSMEKGEWSNHRSLPHPQKSKEAIRGVRCPQEIQVLRVCEGGGKPNIFPGQHEKPV